MSCNLYRISGLHYTSLRVNRSMMDLKKSILLLFICGVFGDEVKTVMEGDSVTLDSDLTDIKKYWLISWKIGDYLIAQISEDKISYKNGSDGRFRNRLQLDSKTASLTITNMRTKHSGLYELDAISSSSPSISKKFTVSVYESPAAVTVVEAEIKSVYVTAGESLTLQTDVTDPHGDQLIVWRFGEEEKLIAKADLEAKKNSLYDPDERFRDRLKLDHQTGSLTITNFKYTDSRLYMVKISSSKQTSHKKFIVAVTDSGWSPGAVAGIVVVVLLAVFAAVAAAGFLYHRWKVGEVMKVIVKERDPVTLNTGVTELQTGDKIQWWYGDTLIAEITGGKEQTHDERFSCKLTLNKDTGNLNITRSEIIHSGLYKLKITRKICVIPIPTHKRFILTVEMKTVQNEGKKLTLSIPDGTDLQKDDLILWMFGPKGSVIAKFDRVIEINTTYDGPDGIFKDKLKLDEKTGSLTITNIKPEHAGVYELQLSNSERTINRKFKFKVPERAQSYTPEMRRAQSNTPELRRTQSAELIKPPTISEELKKLQNEGSESTTVEMRLLSE